MRNISQKLNTREQGYATVEKEGLAIKWVLERLRYYLLGRHFTLVTDHTKRHMHNIAFQVFYSLSQQKKTGRNLFTRTNTKIEGVSKTQWCQYSINNICYVVHIFPSLASVLSLSKYTVSKKVFQRVSRRNNGENISSYIWFCV